LYLSLFLDAVSFFGDKKKEKKVVSLQLNPFLSIFSTGQAFFKSLEEVISSGEVS